MAEGKCSIPPHISTKSKCEGCGNSYAAFYCHDCPVALCNSCVVPHRNIKTTAKHQLTTLLSLDKSLPRSGNAEIVDIQCSDHPTSFVNSICRTCEEVLCNSCKSSHRRHTIIDPKSDLGLLQKIAVSIIAKLSAHVLELDTAKHSASDKIKFYKEIKSKIESWRQVIVDCTNTSSESLQLQIDQHIKKIESNVQDSVRILTNDNKTTDEHINKMNAIRRTTDPEMLLAGIAEGNIILRKGRIALTPAKTPRIENVLPNMSLLDPLQTDIKKFFMVVLEAIDLVADVDVVDYTKLNELKDFEIESRYFHSICEGKTMSNILTLYAPKVKEIITLDLDTFSSAKHKSDVALETMISTSTNRYVIKVYQRNEINLLNNRYKTLMKLTPKRNDEFNPVTICLYGENAFLECSSSTKSPRCLRFTKVSVENDIFVSTVIASIKNVYFDDPKFIRLHKNKHNVTMVTDDMLYQVDLTTSTVNTHDVGSRNLYSLFVDDLDNILIGDMNGCIDLYSPKLEHSKVLKTSGCVSGIGLHNGQLIVCHGGGIYGEPHITLFQ